MCLGEVNLKQKVGKKLETSTSMSSLRDEVLVFGYCRKFPFITTDICQMIMFQTDVFQTVIEDIHFYEQIK
jgi:hypothetical protein